MSSLGYEGANTGFQSYTWKHNLELGMHVRLKWQGLLAMNMAVLKPCS